MEGSADQSVHMAQMISPTFLSGTSSFFVCVCGGGGERKQLAKWSFLTVQTLVWEAGTPGCKQKSFPERRCGALTK